MAGEGKKGKKLARMSLIPGWALFRLAEVYGIGEKKYAPHNWRRGGIPYSSLFDSMIRHAYQWNEGEEVDRGDNQKHLASVAWMAFALMELSETHPEDDDRPHKFLGAEPRLLDSDVTNPEEIEAARNEVTEVLPSLKDVGVADDTAAMQKAISVGQAVVASSRNFRGFSRSDFMDGD